MFGMTITAPNTPKPNKIQTFLSLMLYSCEKYYDETVKLNILSHHFIEILKCLKLKYDTMWHREFNVDWKANDAVSSV